MPSPTLPDFEIFIGDKKFRHFTRGFVKLSLEQAASQFEFQYADLSIDAGDEWPIDVGDPCTIKLQDRLLLTGFIDDLSVQYAADRLQLTARGRSNVGDLVDSSAHYKRGRWSKATLQTIADNLCEPFDVKVDIDRVGNFNKPFPRFALDPGETVIEALTRAAKYRGLYPVSDPDGRLRFMAVGARELPAQLEYGVNIIRGERFDSYSSRHSAYFLRGQSPSDDDAAGRTTAEENAAIFDEQIQRYRPLLMVSTSQKGKADLQRRAIWERNRRAGEGERLIYRVDGFGFGQGAGREVWMPGPLVPIKDKRLRVDSTLVLSACVYRFDAEGENGGRVTDLTFTRKEAFDLKETYPRRNRGDWDGGYELTNQERAIMFKRHFGWDDAIQSIQEGPFRPVTSEGEGSVLR